MNPGEAREQIIENDCSNYCSLWESEECKNCRWGVAIKALEKQIPKDPYLYGDGYSEGELVIDMYECPNCGVGYELEYKRYKCCPNCGQRLDWDAVDWEETE